MKTLLITLLASAAMLTSSANAAIYIAEVNDTGSADVHIRNTYANQDGVNPMIVGQFTNGSHSRILLRFDLSDLIALGTISINSVSLIGKNEAAGSGTVPLNVHEYSYDFIENAATWTNPDGSAGGDETAGGTFVSTVLSSLSHSSNAGVVATFASSASFVSLIQEAVDGDTAVNLMIKRSSESASNNFIRFLDESSADRFKLSIDYTVIPEPSAALLGSLGFLFLFRRRR